MEKSETPSHPLNCTTTGVTCTRVYAEFRKQAVYNTTGKNAGKGNAFRARKVTVTNNSMLFYTPQLDSFQKTT
jgi:hypothetical protein